MPLTWQARAAGGHYAVDTVAGGASSTLSLLGSYNAVVVRPVRLYIGNHGNDGIVEVALGGIVSRIAPYTVKSLSVENITSVIITNTGTASASILICDIPMPELVEDIFASLVVTTATSYNNLLYHFDDVINLNSGSDASATAAARGATSLLAAPKFGATCLTSPDAASGLIITTSALFNLNNDLTLDYWCGQPVVAAGQSTIMLRIGSEFDDPLEGVILTFDSSFPGYRLRVNGVAAFGAAAAVTAPFTHMAITKIGSTWRVFRAGVNIITAVIASSGIYNNLAVNADVLTGIDPTTGQPYQAFTGNFDELRHRAGVGLWNAAFTPPVAPYT